MTAVAVHQNNADMRCDERLLLMSQGFQFSASRQPNIVTGAEYIRPAARRNNSSSAQRNHGTPNIFSASTIKTFDVHHLESGIGRRFREYLPQRGAIIVDMGSERARDYRPWRRMRQDTSFGAAEPPSPAGNMSQYTTRPLSLCTLSNMQCCKMLQKGFV